MSISIKNTKFLDANKYSSDSNKSEDGLSSSSTEFFDAKSSLTEFFDIDAAVASQHNYDSSIDIGARSSGEEASLISNYPKSVQEFAQKIGKASSSVIGKWPCAYDGGFFKKAGRAALISGVATGYSGFSCNSSWMGSWSNRRGSISYLHDCSVCNGDKKRF